MCCARYEIVVTLPPIAHRQCGRSAGRMLTSVGEKIENRAECHYSDKLKEYKISIRLSIFHTTKEISLLQKESISIQHPLSTVLQKACEAINFLRAHAQRWTVKMLISVTLSFFFFSFACSGIKVTHCRNILQWIIMLPPCIWLIHWERISSWETSNVRALLMFSFLLIFLPTLGEESGWWRGVKNINFHLLSCLGIMWTTHTAEQVDFSARGVNTNKKAVVTQIKHYAWAKNSWYITHMQIESISITSDPACKHQIPGILLETIHY